MSCPFQKRATVLATEPAWPKYPHCPKRQAIDKTQKVFDKELKHTDREGGRESLLREVAG